ncbi:putative protein containing trypsin domains, partial [Operophtera brumata]
MMAAEPNVFRMHSNIGLVFVVRPVLNLFIQPVEFGKYYATELQNTELITVGYGDIRSSRAVVLQYEIYDEAPCPSPRWYYCICGVESNHTTETYENYFGNGAPVFLGYEVVGVTAFAAGTLYLSEAGEKYNVFTVIAPYLPWIEKAD